MVDPYPELIAVLDAKFTQFEKRAAQEARAYDRWRLRFERLHFLLGVPATVLAGAAGATAFTERVSGIVVGLCAVLAAALAAAQTIIRPDSRGRFNQTQQFALHRLATQAARFRELSLPLTSADAARARLESLDDELFAVLSRSPE